LRELIKKLTDRSKYGILAKSIVHNRKLRSSTGATHKRMDLSQSLEYITRVFEDYRNYGGLSDADINNKTILEIGPGDNLGVALKFCALGAKKIICLDRFHCEGDTEQQREIYKALLAAMESQQRNKALQAISGQNHKFTFNPQKLEYICGTGIENAEGLLAPQTVDIVISRAVLQYVEGPDKAFAAMDHLLKKGGRLIHKIDLRDHGMFTERGLSPMEFLTVPDLLWKWISPHASKTNRCRVDFYRDKLKQLNYDFELYVTHVMGQEGDLAPHKLDISEGIDYTAEDVARLAAARPRLLKRFQALSDKDLLISGIFLVARKR
jgi:SAM-dependent methyltransferase